MASVFLLMTCFLLTLVVLLLFFFASMNQKWDFWLNSIFECGFTSYYFSRFSFSVHYFVIALIFLFLDLELCMLMPFFNEPLSGMMVLYLKALFIFILLGTLLQEWSEGKLDWVN